MSDELVVLRGAALYVPDDDEPIEPGHEHDWSNLREGWWMAVQEGRVVEVGVDEPPAAPLDLGNVVVAPGYVDLQVNGVGPVDFWVATPEEWRDAGRRQLASGVTSYCPTLVSAPLDAYGPALDRVAAAQADAYAQGLPEIAGVHLEGPFLGGAPGAHPTEVLRAMDLDWLEDVLDRHSDLVTIVTLAPEADPDLLATGMLADRGIVVSLGHTTCTYDQANAAFLAGARLVTHLYTGMAPLHHRNPGLLASVLENELDWCPTMIADNIHVSPPAQRIAWQAAPYLALVTDAVATGVDYFGQRVEERDGAAYLADGTLVGSTLTMEAAVRNFAANIEWPDAAIGCGSEIPAHVLGLDTYGALGVGGRADLVALDADSLDVVSVWLGGEQAYAR
jgi:N-acetylglucosamine-6-phosphate deacetylase